MDDQSFFDLQLNGLHAICRTLPSGAPSSSNIELEGVSATLAPVAPNRSVCNAVTYRSADALEAAHDQLAALYDEAGIAKWAVWVPGGDDLTAKLLEERGHVLDAAPRAMAMELAAFDTEPVAGIEIDDRINAATVGAINDLGWKAEGDELSDSMAQTPEGLRFYGARLDGEYRSCIAALDHSSDCLIWFVATDPAVQGQGLAGALMIHALRAARERGCATTTLQASEAGFPIYKRLGYRDIGEMQLWEKRGTG